MAIETPAYRQIYSTGFLAQRFQLAVPTIIRVCEERGIGPQMLINETPHYDGMAYLELVRYVKERERNGN